MSARIISQHAGKATLSIDSPDLNADQFRVLAGQRLRFATDEHDGDYHLNPDFREFILARDNRAAAVLIGVVERTGGLNVILTKRHDHLRSHSGQVAFPGGKIDASDASVEAAALREAHEEIRLEPDRAEVLGRLPDYYTGSGFCIAPVVALIDPAAALDANPDEVDYIFEAPLAFLMDQANHQKGSRQFQGKTRHYIEMDWQGHYIWGVTAGMLRAMYDRFAE